MVVPAADSDVWWKISNVGCLLTNSLKYIHKISESAAIIILKIEFTLE
jgi:hypothetical protein